MKIKEQTRKLVKIKDQTRKLATGRSKHSFEVADKTYEVSNHTHSKATLTPV
ncbi:chlorohydrolase [Streptococcus pneumoniae]|nr:chlorohydrolase [Streptococcus pneumoniae]